MKLAIVGSRDFKDYNVLKLFIAKWFAPTEIKTIISGGAVGVDSYARRYALDNNIELIEHLPDYNRYGKRAPIVRNELIIKDSDIVLALWDGISRGTGNSLSIAKKLKKTTFVVYI